MSARWLQNNSPLIIRYPLLWLALAVALVYGGSVAYGLTGLDDTIFICKLQHYNSHPYHLLSSFRLLFGPWNNYYRPILFDSILVNYLLCGSFIAGYHIVNILLHIIAVCLLYVLLVKLKVRPFHSFILALIFAVHPVLSQAVAWIPGRNDVLLALFTFSFYIFSVDFLNKGNSRLLLFSTMSLLLALFTKETAVFAPLGLIIITKLMLTQALTARRMLIQYVVWALCLAFYFIVKPHFQRTHYFSPLEMLHNLVYRLPLLLQYVGKLFFPFNLGVFPNQEDTSNYYGVAAVALLAILIYTGAVLKKYTLLVSGALIFLMFLAPELLISANLISRQTFEHRLYLPIFGILLMLSQTALFHNKLNDRQLSALFAFPICFLAVVNMRHQENFASPVAFWEQAVRTSPSSAQACVSLAGEINDLDRSMLLLQRARKLNPKESYIDFTIAKVLQLHDSILASEPYLLTEKHLSKYYECDFYLARVELAKNNVPGARLLYRNYISGNPYYSQHDIDKLLDNQDWRNDIIKYNLICH